LRVSTPPSRPLPYVGLPVHIVYPAVESAVVSAVADSGRALTVDGSRFTLRRTNGRFIREGEPYYGVRLTLRADLASAGE
jgi:hypothetical protein